MVLPFLSKYLKENLHFTYGEVGWIMVSFGVGSMLGSWLGGKLTDKVGFYKIMVFSLFTSGLMFFGLIHHFFLGIVHRDVCHYDHCRHVSSGDVRVPKRLCKTRKPGSGTYPGSFVGEFGFCHRTGSWRTDNLGNGLPRIVLD